MVKWYMVYGIWYMVYGKTLNPEPKPLHLPGARFHGVPKRRWRKLGSIDDTTAGHARLEGSGF